MTVPANPQRGSALRSGGGRGLSDLFCRFFRSLTITGAFTAPRSWAYPDRSDTHAGLQAQTFVGMQTISNATASTTTTTGALVVAGGVGVAGSVYANVLSAVTGVHTDGAAVTGRGFKCFTSGSLRWNISFQNAESGGDAGTDISFEARTDAGAVIDQAFSIVRAAGGLCQTTRPFKTTSTTDSSSVSTGGMVGSGGLGVAKRIFGGTIGTTFQGHVLAGVQDGTADTAGAVGETLSSTVSGVAAAATGTVGNATSISVTRGKWMPRASVVISAGATGLTANSTIKVSIVTTSATNGTSGSTMVRQSVPALIANGLWTLSINLPDININATATYYLTVEITYTAGSPTIDGSLIFTRSR